MFYTQIPLGHNFQSVLFTNCRRTGMKTSVVVPVDNDNDEFADGSELYCCGAEKFECKLYEGCIKPLKKKKN